MEESGRHWNVRCAGPQRITRFLALASRTLVRTVHLRVSFQYARSSPRTSWNAVLTRMRRSSHGVHCLR